MSNSARMSNNADLLVAARTEYDGTANTYMAQADCWYARELGAHFQATGRSTPDDVEIVVGGVIWANNMRFAYTNEAGQVKFERTG
jgi:hypothetical protein